MPGCSERSQLSFSLIYHRPLARKRRLSWGSMQDPARLEKNGARIEVCNIADLTSRTRDMSEDFLSRV